jgi:DNA ligase (NAD+)
MQFPCVVSFSTVKTTNALLSLCRAAQNDRPTYDFDIDGIVVKCNTIDFEDVLRPHPQKQIAFKFPPEEQKTRVKRIYWSEHGGTYTPMAEFDPPVELAGSVVSRASLHNPNMLRRLGITVDSIVSVSRRGDVIPQVEKVYHRPPGATEPQFPRQCIVCNMALHDGGSRLYCPNSLCPKKVRARIAKWIDVHEVRDFGPKLQTYLFDKGLVREIADLYDLTVDTLVALPRMGEVSARKVIDALHTQTRNTTMVKFIAGFNIEGVGERVMEVVVLAGCDTLGKLRRASVENLSSIRGIGQVIAEKLARGLVELAPEMDRVVQKLPNAPGTANVESRVQGNDLSGMSFCFTGRLETMSRVYAEDMVKALGGSIRKNVSRNLTYLVTNTPNSDSSKNRMARTHGTQIVSEQQFISIAGCENDT